MSVYSPACCRIFCVRELFSITLFSPYIKHVVQDLSSFWKNIMLLLPCYTYKVTVVDVKVGGSVIGSSLIHVPQSAHTIYDPIDFHTHTHTRTTSSPSLTYSLTLSPYLLCQHKISLSLSSTKDLCILIPVYALAVIHTHIVYLLTVFQRKLLWSNQGEDLSWNRYLHLQFSISLDISAQSVTYGLFWTLNYIKIRVHFSRSTSCVATAPYMPWNTVRENALFELRKQVSSHSNKV